MHTLRDEINAVFKNEKIAGIEFVRHNDWQWILKKLANEFLLHGEQNLNNIWLWEVIAEPYTSYQSNNGIDELKALLTPLECYWFIVSDEDRKYWVLDGTGEAIIKVLLEMRYFEYYITNKNMTGLVCENHHNVILIKGSL
jgi:hypothetical protein